MLNPLRWGQALIAVSFVLSCSATRDVDTDDHCKEAGYSIANRTLTCTGDPDLANGQYEAYDEQYRCLSSQPPAAADYACAVELRTLPCADVLRFGESIDAWLSDQPACAAIVERKDGSDPVRPCAADQIRCSGECVYPLTDARHCGVCDNACQGDGQKPPTCIDGACIEPACPPDKLDCDDDPTTCETKNGTVENCLGCGVVCPERPNSVPLCGDQGCIFFCSSGWDDCDDNANNGCESEVKSPQACGACGVACSAEEGAPFNQVAVCQSGKCSVECKEGYEDCGGSAETCETNINVDQNHCGGCNQPCSTTCENGVCT